MARDIFHYNFKSALEKEGWIVTDDPLRVSYEDIEYSIDLAAERLMIAEKGEEKIAVEIKTFGQQSIINAFHEAIGQFINYRIALRLTNPERVLYLAVPDHAYKRFLSKPFGIELIEQEHLKIIVFDPLDKKIVQWIK